MATQVATPYRSTFAAAMSGAPAWFAVHTASRREKQVAQHFTARGVDHFLPLYEEAHRWADRRVQVQLPLFPGYLFARITLADRKRVLEVPGVARLVGFNGCPQPVETVEIEALQHGVSAGIVIEPHPYLKSGSRVRVTGGPLRGVEGIMIRRNDGARVVISVDLIMRSVAVEIDVADIQPVP